MAAPINNQNARKWTEDRVWSYLHQISELARDKKHLYLGQVLEELGLYQDVWMYWVRKFGGNEEMMEEMELIKETLESKVFEAGCRKEIKAARCIMILKRHYGWRESGKSERLTVSYTGKRMYDKEVKEVRMWAQNNIRMRA